MVGSRRTDKPLLRVSATRFLASAAGEAAKKVEILAERNSDAVPGELSGKLLVCLECGRLTELSEVLQVWRDFI